MSNDSLVPLSDWLPDWASRRGPAARPATTTQDPRPIPAAPEKTASGTEPPRDPHGAESETTAGETELIADGAGRNGFVRLGPAKVILVTPNEDRTVRRKLRGIHLFMITINATLGTGLYWRGGQILQLGGPLAVLLSFLLVGALAWAVMQCITEMLCIWPIPGAMSIYVGEFVDVELGLAVGITYWFTYSVSFSALIAVASAEFDFWPGFQDKPGVQGGVIYLCIPLLLVLVNAFRIEIYGMIEVVSGAIKILFLGAIMVALIAINLGAGAQRERRGGEYWAASTAYDTAAARDWGTALLMCMSIATFAYVGVEVIAASALEAKWPRTRQPDARADSNLSRRSNDSLIGNSVKFSAIFISVLAGAAYTLSGALVTLDISRDDCQLPRLSWVHSSQAPGTGEGECVTTTSSAFVAIAQQSLIPSLADVFNAFLIFTALTCANTNLYVASRTLFGLTSRLDGGAGQPWLLRVLAWFGKTNRRKVPMRATVFSAVAFSWVPFLRLAKGVDETSPIGVFIEVLSEMGSVGVLIVWACECLAFIRYYHCIDLHRGVLQAKKISQVRRWDFSDASDYPYRSHGQPLLAYLALSGCLFVLLVANSSPLWNGFFLLPFLSSYLIVRDISFISVSGVTAVQWHAANEMKLLSVVQQVIVFIALWVLLKLVRGASWSMVDLSNPDRVVKKLRDLHDIRLGAT
ncbi:amino acid transporter [Cercophora scortea]|uniref:Amino acid transporter n=1 Tax=Cercophora scortea TaxID=314031 RepID=A0AAE0J1K4_9PEZI|nr:amino acid transporter [Cercophora scortea]